MFIMGIYFPEMLIHQPPDVTRNGAACCLSHAGQTFVVLLWERQIDLFFLTMFFHKITLFYYK